MNEQDRKEISGLLIDELEEAERELEYWQRRIVALRDAVYGISHPGSWEEQTSEWVFKDTARRLEEKRQS